MDDFSTKTLERIRCECPEPKPRWHFVARDAAVWAGFLVSFTVGSVAFATTLFLVIDQDWDIGDRLGITRFEQFALGVPYFWVGTLALFAALAVWHFRLTRRGYRLAAPLLVAAMFVGSSIAGTALFALGVDAEPHVFLADVVPHYRTVVFTKERVWSRPDLGLESGRIVAWTSTREFAILDLQGNLWRVEGAMLVWPTGIATSGAKVRLLGSVRENGVFFAEALRPWNYGPWDTPFPARE